VIVAFYHVYKLYIAVVVVYQWLVQLNLSPEVQTVKDLALLLCV
jgi:hypothetical protein